MILEDAPENNPNYIIDNINSAGINRKYKMGFTDSELRLIERALVSLTRDDEIFDVDWEQFKSVLKHVRGELK